MKEITERQKEVLAFLHVYVNEKGYPPTTREIADHFQFKSVNTVVDHLHGLEKKRYIRRDSGVARGISILK